VRRDGLTNHPGVTSLKDRIPSNWIAHCHITETRCAPEVLNWALNRGEYLQVALNWPRQPTLVSIMRGEAAAPPTRSREPLSKIRRVARVTQICYLRTLVFGRRKG
jgi:hypothetical protein